VIEKLESYLLWHLDKDREAEELEEDYRSVIFDDASKFDGMKIRRVRRHWCAMRGDEVDFYDECYNSDDEEDDSDDDKDEYEATEEEIKAFRANNTKFRCCILIDDEVLQSILNAPATPKEASKIRPKEFESIGYVKVVDLQSGPGSGADYPGWMTVDLTCLWYIYGLDDLEAEYPYKDPKTGKRIVYTGDLPSDPTIEYHFGGVPFVSIM
jgi:hypothetical protein